MMPLDINSDEVVSSTITLQETKEKLYIIAVHLHKADPIGSFSFINEIRQKCTGVANKTDNVNVDLQLYDLRHVVRSLGQFPEVFLTDFNKGLKDNLVATAVQYRQSENEIDRLKGDYIIHHLTEIGRSIIGYLESAYTEAIQLLRLPA